MVRKNPRLFPKLISGLWHDDLLVRLRAADVTEKVTRKTPELLAPHKKELLGLMAEAGDLIMHPLREALDRCAIPSAAATVELRRAQLGDAADIQGAIHLASVLSHTQATKALTTTA